MMNRNTTLLLLICITLFTSCDDGNLISGLGQKMSTNSKGIVKKEYFDIKHWLDERIDILNRNTIVLNKVYQYNGVPEEKILETVDWKKTLSFIEFLDINQKKYRGRFDVKKETLKNGSVISIYKQKDKDDLKPPLYQLNIEYGGVDNDKIMGVKAHLFFLNYLYVKKEIVELNFDENGVLRTYLFKGGNKMLWQDSISYEVKGQLVINNKL